MTLNIKPSCLYLRRPGVTGMHTFIQLLCCWEPRALHMPGKHATNWRMSSSPIVVFLCLFLGKEDSLHCVYLNFSLAYITRVSSNINKWRHRADSDTVSFRADSRIMLSSNASPWHKDRVQSPLCKWSGEFQAMSTMTSVAYNVSVSEYSLPFPSSVPERQHQESHSAIAFQ